MKYLRPVAAVHALLLLVTIGCHGEATAIAPGEDKTGIEIEFSSPTMSKDAELVAKARLRQAGARSYQVWRRDAVVKARVVSIADPTIVRALLGSTDGSELAAPIADVARQAPYPEPPADVRQVAPDAL